MREFGSRLKKNNILLYSAILSLMLGCNNFANAEDLPISVSTGTELQSVIQKPQSLLKYCLKVK